MLSYLFYIFDANLATIFIFNDKLTGNKTLFIKFNYTENYNDIFLTPNNIIRKKFRP